MCSWADATHVHGDKLIEWLEQHHLHPPRQTGSMADTLRKWRNDTDPTVFKADEWLTRLGIVLAELPDELFYAAETSERRPGPRGRKRVAA